jgi:hypothetical protein
MGGPKQKVNSMIWLDYIQFTIMAKTESLIFALL